ncbi:MAG: hypothetical protein WC459_01325 [Patescibacteria group bacterium]
MDRADHFISEFKGNIPFIISVRDDGFITKIDKQDLPFAKRKRKNDTGTARLAATLKMMSKNFVPYFVFQQVKRDRLTNEIRQNFYKRTLILVYECLTKWNKCCLLDLHAFGTQIGLGQYDIIFGTDHRKTINNDFDTQLAKQLGGHLSNITKELRIYVPEERVTREERFGATKVSTLTKWIKTNEPRVDAVQIEIYKDWLANQAKLVALAMEFNFAICHFVR